MQSRLLRISLPLLGIMALAAIAGCEKSSPPATAAPNPAEIKAKLADADAVDGTVDRVVAKCAICALGMHGSAKHASSFEGYSLQFCSADCKKLFDKDPIKTVAALKIPKKGNAD